MGFFNIFDILNDIYFKKGKTNTLIKWIIALSILGVATSFAIGQLKMRHLNKLDDIESLAVEGINKTEKLELEIKKQNKKIEKIYDVGNKAFNEYWKFNNEQLKLIIDHGNNNKELIKEIIDINSKKKAIDIKNDINKAKNNKINNKSMDYPKIYTKENFIKALKKNNIEDNIINRVKELPLNVTYNDSLYRLNIIVSWDNNNDTHYEFEINYYSKDNMDFLFDYKVFYNIENNLNYIECNLENLNN
jgi:hypothetical protein